MNNTMEYKGYVGSVEFSEEDVIFYGKVMGIRSLISYKGSFNVRISPELHKKIVIYAMEHDITLNRYVEQTLEKSPAAVQM